MFLPSESEWKTKTKNVEHSRGHFYDLSIAREVVEVIWRLPVMNLHQPSAKPLF